MIVTRAETAQQYPPLIGLAISVGVSEEEQLRAVAHVRAAIADFQSGWNHQTVRKNRGLVTAAISVGVFEDQHLVVGHLAGFDLRIHGAANHPEPPPCVKAHLNWLHDT